MKNYVKDLDKIFQDVLRQEKKSRRSFFYYIAIPVLLGIAILYYTSKTTLEKDIITKELREINEIKRKEAIISKKIENYFDIRSNHSADGLDSLYDEHLQLYFKLHNVDKKEVFDNDNLYWKKGNSERYYLQEDPQISQTKDSYYVTLTKINYCKDDSKNRCRDLIFEIRFNKNYKIYYVNAYQLADIQNLYK